MPPYISLAVLALTLIFLAGIILRLRFRQLSAEEQQKRWEEVREQDFENGV